MKNDEKFVHRMLMKLTAGQPVDAHKLFRLDVEEISRQNSTFHKHYSNLEKKGGGRKARKHDFIKHIFGPLFTFNLCWVPSCLKKETDYDTPFSLTTDRLTDLGKLNFPMVVRF